MKDLEFEMKKVQLRDGDILVCVLPAHTQDHVFHAFADQARDMVRRLGVKAEVAVLIEGSTLEVVTRSDLADVKQRLDDLAKKLKAVVQDLHESGS